MRDAEDTARLDWMIEPHVWVQWTTRNDSIRQCQIYDQEETVKYSIRSGENRYFNTPREAIDAARKGNNSAFDGNQTSRRRWIQQWRR
ncbi:hypothetical protein P5W99_24595 [Paraburkholderia sp. A3BS-1L]|uniref:hypothetical protein n=1 Tax=Paraburkholderia sp. A3BS-1L TaxID=3028375 RepID=UPI003DA8CE86